MFIIEDGKANIRSLKLGVSLGPRVVVLAGLKNADIVVVRGNERLRMPRMALEGELRDRALMIIAEAKMNHARI